MKYRNGIIALGVLVAIVKPIIYFPPGAMTVIYAILGLGIAVLAYQSGRATLAGVLPEKRNVPQPKPSEPSSAPTSVETN